MQHQPSATVHYLMPSEPSRFTHTNLHLLLTHATNIEASDITIQTDSQVMAEVHGQLHAISHHKTSNTEVSELLNELYGPNGTAQLMSGRDLDTSYEINHARNRRYRFRVNATAIHILGHHAIQITIRTIPSTPPSLDSLQLPTDLQNAIAPNNGVIYVTGPTGSGKTTLLAAIVRHLIEDQDAHRKVVTYEAPIEYVYDHISTPHAIISQSEIPTHITSFADGVRNALRRKPHAILVGEARDQETILAVVEAALTGHPVYTTLHTNGVSETIRRLVGSFPREERVGRTIDIIETVRAIIWQQLVPGLDGKRIALREYLVFDENIRDQILDCDPEKITQHIRNMLLKHGQPMLHDAQQKFEQGLISERTLKFYQRSHVSC